jgi:hypothetical protein
MHADFVKSWGHYCDRLQDPVRVQELQTNPYSVIILQSAAATARGGGGGAQAGMKLSTPPHEPHDNIHTYL